MQNKDYSNTLKSKKSKWFDKDCINLKKEVIILGRQKKNILNLFYEKNIVLS